MPQPTIPKTYPVWWETGTVDGEWNIATVLDCKPYKGNYPELFTHVLKLSSTTRRGYLEMTVKLE